MGTRYVTVDDDVDENSVRESRAVVELSSLSPSPLSHLSVEDRPLAAASPADIELGGANGRANSSSTPSEAACSRQVVWRYVGIAVAVGVVLSLAFLALGGEKSPSKPIQPPSLRSRTVIQISFDGFRWDYLNGRTRTPNLDFLRSQGAQAESLRPIFPSKTFPNHYTLVTGLYAESHGIVANVMWDPVFKAEFTLTNGGPREARWWQGEPVWVTAMKNNLRVGCLFWPGCEAPIAGMYPTFYRPYDFGYPYANRVQQILDWMALPDDEAPQLILAYFDAADTQGHQHGPDSPQVTSAIKRLDDTLGSLLNGVRDLGMWNTTDFVMVADHGMTNITFARTVYLDDYVDLSASNVIDTSPVLELIPLDLSRSAEFVANLSKVPHVTAWLKEDVPERLHFSHNRRIAPVVALADLGWTMASRGGAGGYSGTRGNHGFDNLERDMEAYFVASGPSFRSGVRVSTVNNTAIYPLTCHLLGITPAPCNNSISASPVRHMLVGT